MYGGYFRLWGASPRPRSRAWFAVGLLSIAALSSWSAGRASPRPHSSVRIPRDATLCVFPCKRFTEVPHHHTTISPDNVAAIASIWRGFAPTAHYLGPHCRATMPPSCWLTSSPHLVGLRPDGAFPLSNGAPLASLHSQRLTWSPRGRARWDFAPTSLGFLDWVGLRPDSASPKIILSA